MYAIRGVGLHDPKLNGLQSRLADLLLHLFGVVPGTGVDVHRDRRIIWKTVEY